MSKNINTAATTAAPKLSLKERCKASWNTAKSYCKLPTLPKISAPSIGASVFTGVICLVAFVGLYLFAAVGVMAGAADTAASVIENAVQSGASVTMGENGVTITPAAAGPTIGQRIYGAGQTVYGYTVQPVVNADGAVKNRVFGGAPVASASAPVTQLQ